MISFPGRAAFAGGGPTNYTNPSAGALLTYPANLNTAGLSRYPANSGQPFTRYPHTAATGPRRFT